MSHLCVYLFILFCDLEQSVAMCVLLSSSKSVGGSRAFSPSVGAVTCRQEAQRHSDESNQSDNNKNRSVCFFPV